MSAYFDAYRPFRQYRAMSYTMPYGNGYTTPYACDNNMFLPAQEMNREMEQDMEYWMDLYPAQIKRMQRFVEEECDRNDYDGSAMYDEFPDRVQLGRITDRILEQMERDGTFTEEMDAQMQEIMPEEEPEEGLETMQVRRRRRNPLVRDLVSVLLFNELHRRRCRGRHCRRW